jgi:hypothetical protein
MLALTDAALARLAIAAIAVRELRRRRWSRDIADRLDLAAARVAARRRPPVASA